MLYFLIDGSNSYWPVVLFIPDVCLYFPTYTNLIGNKQISNIFIALSSSLVARVLVAFTLYPHSPISAQFFTARRTIPPVFSGSTVTTLKRFVFSGRPKKKKKRNTHTHVRFVLTSRHGQRTAVIYMTTRTGTDFGSSTVVVMALLFRYVYARDRPYPGKFRRTGLLVLNRIYGRRRM